MFWFRKPQTKQRVMLKHEWTGDRLEFTLAHAKMLGGNYYVNQFGGEFDECRDMVRLNADGSTSIQNCKWEPIDPLPGFSAAV